ncbi:MAG: FAD:protein FMN transferase [Actinomycetota bacterium]|nr:FAD:protein FMN transferase [Actinomycetota bacterium]
MIAERPAAGLESAATFPCFGSECTVSVAGPADAAAGAVARCRHQLLQWHAQFSRFTPDSEITRLNDDPGTSVQVSPLMRRLLQAAVRAAHDTGGLVDPTLVGEIEAAGYARHFEGSGIPLHQALRLAPPRTPGHGRAGTAWRKVSADRRTSTVTRPPGVRLDPGGIAKGVFADELAASLSSFAAFVIDCAGDLRLGGVSGIQRPVHVASPFDESVLHTFALCSAGVATSGIARRSWMRDGRPAHHLLDPAKGTPAFTGVVQATALAPNATEAEALSKAALLSGPEAADGWLPHGGVIVFDDGSHRVVQSN